MITCNAKATFGSRRFLWSQLGLLVLAVISLLYSCAHAAPLAGTIISNMAVGEYKEEGSSVVQTSRSNLVQTTIIPVYTFTLTANRSVQASAGQRVFFSHELSNTGNSTDRYNLSAANLSGDNFDYSNIVVYLDANRDGVPDGNAISSYSLAAGESVGLLVGATIPAGSSNAALADVQLTATSQTSSQFQQNTDRSTVSNQAVILVRKSFSVSNVSQNQIVTVRLDYENPGSVASGAVSLGDTLNAAQLSYVNDGTENWNGQIVNPASGSNDPAGINYYLNGNTINAVLNSVPAGGSGFIQFKVRVNQALPGRIPNTVQVSYDHDNSNTTADISTTSNTAILNINPSYGVEINGISASASSATADNLVIAPAVSSGGELVFRNYVWNTGNSEDRFNLTFTNNNFPTPHQLEFYRADGVTPLLDSNGDGIADTGLLQAGEKLEIVVKLRTPTTFAATATTNYSVFPQAQSLGNRSKTDTVEDRGSISMTNASRLVDLTNSPETNNNGTGNGNVKNGTNPWKTLSGNSSGIITFPLSVKHTGTPTAYDLSADGDGNFSQIELPQGVSTIRFYEATANSCGTLGKPIEQTRLLADGESQLYCAVVSLKADVTSTSNVPVYFKVASATYVSSNNSSNPGFDTLMNAISINSLNSTGSVVLDPDLRGQIAPGGTIVYSHNLVNNAATALTGNYYLAVTNDQPGFETTLYYDLNNNGELDSNDLLINGTYNINGSMIAAGAQLRIFAKVQNTGYSGIGVVNTTSMLMRDGNNNVIDSVTDITTVSATQIRLLKQQAKDNNCDGVAEGSYTAATLTIGRNANGSGQCVLYRVTVQNQGTQGIGAFNFRDTTPAATVMAIVPVCSSCTANTVSAPALGQSGSLSGTVPAIASGASHVFEFGVRYAGQ
jgi:hypothetical protein